MLSHVVAAAGGPAAAGVLDTAWGAAAIGVAVAAASAAVAWGGLRLSAGRPQLVVAAVLGGTLLRLLLVGAASVALLGVVGIHLTGYVTGLVAAYLVFLALEVVFIARSRRSAEGKAPRRTC